MMKVPKEEQASRIEQVLELVGLKEFGNSYGVSSFKVFMVYDFGVTDGVFYKVLEKAKTCGAMISVHAENKQLIDVLTERSSYLPL